MRGLFSFPNPVNEVSTRLTAGAVALMAAAAVALDQRWLLVVLAYGFVARVLAGPRLSPLALLVTRVITPRLGVAPRHVPGPPKRFAQAIGAVVTVAAVLLAFAFDAEGAAYALAGVLVAFALLESVFAFCVGCKIFDVLMRAGLIPERICLECANVATRG